MSKSLPVPHNEEERLKALHRLQILDTQSEMEYDRITRLAASICNVPIALISLVDENRQWFKSKHGIDVNETPREISICHYAIMGDSILEVEDVSKDPRFSSNPLVVDEPKIRFYAGHPIDDNEGHNLGTLCVIDRKPRKLNDQQIDSLRQLSLMAKDLILLRKLNLEYHVFRKFFKYSLDMLCIAGSDGYFKRLNPAFSKTLGWSDKELMERPFVEFVHEEDVPKTLKEIEKLNEGQPTISFRNRYKSKSGKWVWMHWTCKPDQQTGELYAVAHDISALMEANHKLERAIHHKEIFLSNMSHEVRTPMNAIKGFADLLKKTTLSDEQRDFLETISLASDHLLVIINDVLDASKIESGKLTLEEKAFSLREVVNQVVKLNLNKAKSKGLKIITSIDEEVPALLWGDPVRLGQILVNLVNNAIKFTHEGRVQVNVLVREISDEVAQIELEVSDTGIGIPAAKQQDIFERFEQVDNNSTRKYGGSGLGLSIVKMLVELHGGSIHVKSKPNHGSNFLFDLPLRIAHEARQTRSIINNRADSAALLGDVHILLVEDNAMNQKLAIRYLERHHAHIEVAENGKEAIELLKKKSYDVVLMDLQMPEMDGYQATNVIREELELDIPIIACTAHSLVGEQQRCIEIGMNAYISKPYSEEELIRSIYDQIKSVSGEHLYEEHNQKAQIRGELDNLIHREGSAFVEELMGIYNERIPKDIDFIEKGCDSGDLELVKQKAHLVASSLTTLEFKRGYEISKQLEDAISRSDDESIEQYCKELTDYLKLTLEVTQTYN